MVRPLAQREAAKASLPQQLCCILTAILLCLEVKE